MQAAENPMPFRRRRDVRFRIIDREAVVLRQEAGETLVLNEVGARILQMVDGGLTLETIIETLTSEFDVDPTQADEDTRSFLEELATAGVIETLET
ncbi:MAG: HPr-rel-A system PqqD family peptide chaperone [Acidobacteriota bacterium]